MRLEIDPDLAARLDLVARRLGRSSEDCARSAILTFVADCEETAANAARLAGGDHWQREAFYVMD